MRRFVQIDGRWIAPDQVTHVGVLDTLSVGSTPVPPGSRSYLALTSKTFLYVPESPEEVVALLEGRACDDSSGC